MNVNISLSTTKTLTVKDALLVYTQGHNGDSFITRHSVANGKLGPAQPLTVAFLEALSASAGNRIDTEILPENVLVRTPQTIAWWTPMQDRPMFFSDHSTKDTKGMSGQTYPQPALVWMVRNGQLFVRALKQNNRPQGDTPLYVAPYWNVDNAGRVCHGSMKAPKTESVKAIGGWEDAFFRSEFTHANATKLLAGNRNYLTVLRSMLESRAQLFYPAILLDAKQTLIKFVTKGDK